MGSSRKLRSIKKYGGFYIYAYLLSVEPGGRLSVRKGNSPRNNFNQEDAVGCARFYVKTTGNQNECCSCLPNGAVYDTVFKWMMQMGVNIFEKYKESNEYLEWTFERYKEEGIFVLRKLLGTSMPTRERAVNRWFRDDNFVCRVVLYIK